MGTATTQVLTREEVLREVEALEHTLNMPVEAAEDLAAADRLDADKFQALRRIRDLRWLIEE